MQEGTRITCQWALSCVNGDTETRTCMLKQIELRDTGNTDLSKPDSLWCQQFKWLAGVEELIKRQ